MTSQKKLHILTKNFMKLDENRKDYIRELTHDLVEIHKKGGFLSDCSKKETVGRGK